MGRTGRSRRRSRPAPAPPREPATPAWRNDDDPASHPIQSQKPMRRSSTSNRACRQPATIRVPHRPGRQRRAASIPRRRYRPGRSHPRTRQGCPRPGCRILVQRHALARHRGDDARNPGRHAGRHLAFCTRAEPQGRHGQAERFEPRPDIRDMAQQPHGAIASGEQVHRGIRAHDAHVAVWQGLANARPHLRQEGLHGVQVRRMGETADEPDAAPGREGRAGAAAPGAAAASELPGSPAW